jgi:hypothetical protein
MSRAKTGFVPAASPNFDSLLSKNGEILRQLKLIQELGASDTRAATTEALEAWRTVLLRDLAREAALVTSDNVDTSAKPAARVAQIWPLLGAVVDDLDSNQSAADRLKGRGFLLHVAWHEGARLTTRYQNGGGPARSFFQFEAFRAKEAMEYAQQKGWLATLSTVSAETETKLKAAATALPKYGDTNASQFPANNLVHDLLVGNDLFGAYLARIAFKKVTAAIPASNKDQAAYWYKWWKVTGGDPDELKKTFEAEADEVDKLIPA